MKFGATEKFDLRKGSMRAAQVGLLLIGSALFGGVGISANELEEELEIPESVLLSHGGKHHDWVDVQNVDVVEGSISGWERKRASTCLLETALPEEDFKFVLCTEDPSENEYRAEMTFENAEGEPVFEVEYSRSADVQDGFAITSSGLAELVADSDDPNYLKLIIFTSQGGVQVSKCDLTLDPKQSFSVDWVMRNSETFSGINCNA